MDAARQLLGAYLCRRTADGRVIRAKIAEVELYLETERGCHAFGGRCTPRNDAMFMVGGHTYVYLCYGLHNMLNIVLGDAGMAAAALVRAVECDGGNGPGKLCRAMEITRRDNKIDLTRREHIWIERGDDGNHTILCGPRIGIDYAGADAKFHGEAKNSWLTGTAAWTFVNISQHILGIYPTHQGLRIDPCVPKGFGDFELTRKFREGTYHIKVVNPENVEKGVKSLTVDGKEAAGCIVPYEKGVLSKLDIIMLRLACVARMLAIADGDKSHEVTPTEMKWACDLCRYLHQTQMRVYEELQSGNRQRPMNDCELIRTFFKRFESKGVTQGKLAKLLNTSQPYISQCVNPKAKPTQKTELSEQ